MTDYQQTLDDLFNLQRVGIKLGLDNIHALLAAIGNPQNQFPSIHIAGTNGKGSTAAMLESILRHSGYKVALYTSPHLVNFSERIRIDRVPIPESDVVDFARQIFPKAREIQASFFEVTTAMAFWYIARQQPDIAIIETGLGGRLDATNVLSPLLTLITPVDFDHQIFLGNTIRQIAAEKAGIIKPGTPCLTNNLQPEVLAVLADKCRSLDAPFEIVWDTGSYRLNELAFQHSRSDFHYRDWTLKNLKISLPGEHQVQNALLAIAAARILQNEWRITKKTIRQGMADINWRGRIHRVSEKPAIVIDVSHNPAGFAKTFAFVRQFYPPQRVHVLTFLQNDKDVEQIADIIASNADDVRIVDLKAGKPLPAGTFAAQLRKFGVSATTYQSVEQALSDALETPENNDLWLIIGSHYLAGAAYSTIFP